MPANRYRTIVRAVLFVNIVLFLVMAGCAGMESAEKSPKTLETSAILSRLDELEEKIDALYDIAFEVEARLARGGAAGAEGTGRESVRKAEMARERREGAKAAARRLDRQAEAQASSAQSPEELYEIASEYRRNKEYDEAQPLFTEFLRRYPDHALADNAAYWIGEIYYDTGRYSNAIFAFQDVVSSYPDKAKAPDALLKIGFSYLSLEERDLAKEFFLRVVEEYPLSRAVDIAKNKLAELG
ncbi:MAG: tol-pal system protein YbgF [Desulfatibacillaceae bacterium]